MKLMTTNEAAKVLGKSAQQLRSGYRAGKYPGLPIGSRLMLDVDELQEIIQREEAPGVGIEAISELTGLPIATIRRGYREGWLPAEKVGRAYQFDPEQVLAALQRRMQLPAQVEGQKGEQDG